MSNQAFSFAYCSPLTLVQLKRASQPLDWASSAANAGIRHSLVLLQTVVLASVCALYGKPQANAGLWTQIADTYCWIQQ